MPLDSDVANADGQLHVEFYECDKEPHKGVPFVRIVVPGDKTSIIEQPAKEHHQKRFARQWFAFQMDRGEAEAVGIPLTVWHRERPEEISDGQLTELGILKFQTVEMLSRASDAQMQRVGMGAAGLRERARSYLAGKNAAAGSQELADLKAQVAQLLALQTSGNGPLPTAPEAEKPPQEIPPGFKRGRFGRLEPIKAA